MNKHWLWSGLLLLACGCEGMTNTDRGLVAGGVGGSMLGAGIGALCHHPLIGALFGGAGGMLAGGLIGDATDRRDARNAARTWTANNPPLSLGDVAMMAQKHISDDVIIQQIRTTGSSYNLTPDQIDWLKGQGVSDRVVLVMQSRRAQTVPPPRPSTVYVVEPAPPVVGVGYVGRW